jgi:hypothetical protein
MFQRRLLANLVLLITIVSPLLPGQQKGPQAVTSTQEFPVLLEQNIVAGKTPVGTKVQAKLAIATLVNGAVVPRNAVLSGEVVESAVKTATEPSRLSIRMDSAQWKTGSTPLKIYLTSWYYPLTTESGQNVQYGPTQPANRTWDGQGQYPDPNSKVYRPFPGSDSGKDQSAPDTSSAATSPHRELMKDVQLERANDGTIALVSKHNIKLDKITTYVLANAEALPTK